ncbi:MAG: hypothetical protein K8U03_13975 [Planctomycetia bacterium]|nr:hypothetical protein [Planctomycetia bacterium]
MFAVAARPATLTISTPMSPPIWALLERQLLDTSAEGCREFYAKYFDERGYLLCVERWGGDDGPDDAIENCNDWPLLYALGAHDDVRLLVERAWEGHLRQYTAAKTIEVPMARDGMYYKEFPVSFDWLHNGEGLGVFNRLGLAAPHGRAFEQRVRRYAGFYMNEDPGAPNYDAEKKIIRSLFNGSRGPLLRKATAVDWAGDPIEIAHRFAPKHQERSYEEMLAHFKDYNDIVGDHPQNLQATTLAFNAYALTQEEKYKHWLLEYVDAWRQRAGANGDIFPSNIGLDGKIGGAAGGKWYGGVYGWGFTVIQPHDGKPIDRSTTAAGFSGLWTAMMLTGDDAYLDVWRKQSNAINAQARMIEGRLKYPRMYGDGGWYGWSAEPYTEHSLALYCLSMKDSDRDRVPKHPWLEYLRGANPSYPETALRSDLARVAQRVTEFRADRTTPDTRLADDPMAFNPASVSALLELTLGAPHPGRGCNPICARVRYFDPITRRPGLPADVAALVSRMTNDETDVTLVNVNQLAERTLVVQAGAYGEHEVITLSDSTGKITPIDSSTVRVKLLPGAGGRLTFRMKRYAHAPTFAFPFD